MNNIIDINNYIHRFKTLKEIQEKEHKQFIDTTLSRKDINDILEIFDLAVDHLITADEI